LKGIFPATTHTPVQGQRHEQDQAIQPFRHLELRLFQAKAAAFEI
jgi:hypothetical protein